MHDKIETGKVRKIGNNYVVTLPPSVLAKFDLKEGDEVDFIHRDSKVHIAKQEETSINKEFLELVDDVYQEHRETFEKMADR